MYLHIKLTKIHYYTLKCYRNSQKDLNGTIVRMLPNKQMVYLSAKGYAYYVPWKHRSRQRRMSGFFQQPNGVDKWVKRTHLKRINPAVGETKWLATQL